MRQQFKSRQIVKWLKRCLINTNNPVLVYQMGKVASSSVFKSLKKVPGIHAFHIHRLNPENIASVREEHILRGDLPPDENEGIYLYKKLFQFRKKPARIVTLVREPVSRNISAFFQNLISFEKIPNAHEIIGIENLLSNFVQKYNHDVPLKWFDIEMKSTTGIDVYQHSFPRHKGYQCINAPPYILLIMRHDLDDRIKEKLIADFLEIKSFHIYRLNEASSKEYAEIYKKFINSISLSDDYLHKMLNSKYAHHFFTKNERMTIYKQWSTKHPPT